MEGGGRGLSSVREHKEWLAIRWMESLNGMVACEWTADAYFFLVVRIMKPKPDPFVHDLSEAETEGEGVLPAIKRQESPGNEASRTTKAAPSGQGGPLTPGSLER